MHDAAATFKEKEKAAIAKVQGSKTKSGSLVLPAAGGVQEDCKAFVQRAEHFSHDLLEIVRLFYPEMKKKGWQDFGELVEKTYGPDDQMTKLFHGALPILQIVRDTRDCLDHHLKGVTILDFGALPDGGIFLPSIEIDFKKSRHKRVSVSLFMEEITKSMLNIFEMVTVHMCGKNMKPFAGMAFSIDEVKPPMSEHWPCRFAYGLIYEGQGFVPCG